MQWSPSYMLASVERNSSGCLVRSYLLAKTRFPTDNIITNMYFYFVVCMFLLAGISGHASKRCGACKLSCLCLLLIGVDDELASPKCYMIGWKAEVVFYVVVFQMLEEEQPVPLKSTTPGRQQSSRD